ncbi:MAG: TolC family protein [Proteobacteria bacterium]|nr:TolC family protein [Pseudomonadota bacterium]
MKNLNALLWLACFSGWAAQAAPLGADVEGLLKFAQAHNPELAAIRLEADAASMRVQPAGSLPDPVLRTDLMDITNQGTNKSPDLLPSKVGSTRYLLMQSVPWFGKLDLQSGVAEAQVAGARGQAAVTWADLSGKIKSAYAQRYYLSDSIRLTRETLDLTKNLEKIAQTRYANGLGPQQEVIRVQIEKTDLQTTLIELGNEQHHVHARLNALLSRPADAELSAPEKQRTLPADAQLAQLAEQLRAHNPQLQVADAVINEARMSRDLTYKNRYPGFTFGVAPNQVGSAVKSWDLMVEFNIPLQQASRRSQEREAEAKLAASTAREASLLDQMLSALSESISGLETARHTDEMIAASLLPQAELSFQSALSGYTTGKVDFSVLLEAQRQILKARQQRIRAQYEAQVRMAEIERLIGGKL